MISKKHPRVLFSLVSISNPSLVLIIFIFHQYPHFDSSIYYSADIVCSDKKEGYTLNGISAPSSFYLIKDDFLNLSMLFFKSTSIKPVLSTTRPT